MAKDQKSDGAKVDVNDPIVSAKQLSKLFNLTTTRIGVLARDGIIPKEGRGVYPLYACTKAYIKFLQNKKVNQWDDGETDDKSSFQKENIRRTKEQADALELSNAQKRGELVDVNEVKKLGEKIVGGIKSKIVNSRLPENDKDLILADLYNLRTHKWDEGSDPEESEVMEQIEESEDSKPKKGGKDE